MNEGHSISATERKWHPVRAILRDTRIGVPVLGAMILGSTFLWFIAVALISDAGKSSFGGVSDVWVAVLFGNPFLNLVFAVLVISIYRSNPKRHTVLSSIAIVLALSPWIYWIGMDFVLRSFINPDSGLYPSGHAITLPLSVSPKASGRDTSPVDRIRD